MKREYKLKAKVWIWQGEAGWHFVTLPVEASEEIDFYFAHLKHGFGSLKVSVTIGETTWKTSIFPDKKAKSYLLPLKADVRKKENIHEGDEIVFSIAIQ
jgi:hypothetical protein